MQNNLRVYNEVIQDILDKLEPGQELTIGHTPVCTNRFTYIKIKEHDIATDKVYIAQRVISKKDFNYANFNLIDDYVNEMMKEIEHAKQRS